MLYDIQLSPHFKLSEFLRSDTAVRLGITDNCPSIKQISNLQYLCVNILEPLREFAGRPIIINSGFRSSTLNKAIGGVQNSNHLTGCAADIKVPSNDIGYAWFDYLCSSIKDFDEFIIERNTPASKSFWLHLAIRQDGTNRRKIIKNLIKN